jgi:uncharacterized protein (DUF1330 family)
MPAYVIAEVYIHDHKEYEEYKRRTPAAIAAFDGKFVVRGGDATTLEGDWKPERMVVLEFPTVQRANEWWHSEIYAEVKKIRQRAARTKMIIVEGAEKV